MNNVILVVAIISTAWAAVTTTLLAAILAANPMYKHHPAELTAHELARLDRYIQEVEAAKSVHQLDHLSANRDAVGIADTDVERYWP